MVLNYRGGGEDPKTRSDRKSVSRDDLHDYLVNHFYFLNINKGKKEVRSSSGCLFVEETDTKRQCDSAYGSDDHQLGVHTVDSPHST